ncbi:hypothetical protein NE237_024123 [Protea cynaroides]|uniref:pectinesterase n=1 Tax=Protea cynaroides TaxID=273540 RepID=A0A9Q0HE29_9MAGN|nr:hypothetical protein NE237_024123 [Protea cynaroides]
MSIYCNLIFIFSLLSLAYIYSDTITRLRIRRKLLRLSFITENNIKIKTSIDWSTALLVKVDQSGNGDFKKIQDAIDAVPSNNSNNVFIWIKPGTYIEKVVVPADKPFITLSGSKSSSTIIKGSNHNNIFDYPTLSVLATDFVARYITIQDTILDATRCHYYSSCYIEWDTDFICGNTASFFEKCHQHSTSEGTGAITAQRRESPSENTGFTFLGCKITGLSDEEAKPFLTMDFIGGWEWLRPTHSHFK